MLALLTASSGIPEATPHSMIAFAAMIVGIKNVCVSAIISIASSSINMPCSIEWIPARIATFIPSAL